MDILLITAIDQFSYQIIPDLGLMYLASSVRNAGLSVSLKDLRKDRWNYSRLQKYVRDEKPRIIGIKFFSHELNRVKQMTELIRKENPSCIIVVGGPHPSMDPAGTLSGLPEVDYVFIGESENSFRDFALWVKTDAGGEPPESISGIAFRSSSKTVIRAPVFEENLDKLPMPAWDLTPPNEYPDEATGIFTPGFPAPPMMLSRGCPFGCSYCGSAYVMGKRIRYRSPENVLEEISFLEKNFSVKNFTFIDDNFTCNRNSAMKLFQALAKRQKHISFTFPNGVRAETLDTEMLIMMEKAGCYALALGIESGSDETLKKMRKKQTTEEIKRTVELIRSQTKIRVTGFFILGYPGETVQDVKNTIKFARELKIHHPHFCLFTPLPGTDVYKELQQQGLIPAEGLKQEQVTFDRGFPLPGLSRKKLVLLHQYAYLSFYIKPWRIWNLLKEIRSVGNLWMIIRRAIKLFG